MNDPGPIGAGARVREIELRGHILDSGVFGRVLELIMDHEQARYTIDNFAVGKTATDSSTARLRIEAETPEALEDLLGWMVQVSLVRPVEPAPGGVGAAVGVQGLAGDVGCLVAGQIDSGVGDGGAAVDVNGIKVLAALHREGHGRSVAQLEKKEDPPPPAADASFVEQMAHRVATRSGRGRYKLRQQTVEPVFGIIKQSLGFRCFSLRGQAKASLEWTLVTLAYNFKRLFILGASLSAA